MNDQAEKDRSILDRIEDVEFLDSTGVGATETAQRCGFPTAHAMEKWLERHGRPDLWLSLKRRDPAGAHPSGADRKKQRLMSIPTEQHADTIADLLNDAQTSSRARTRNRASRIGEMVAELRAALSAEREDEQRREKARKEVERLEQKLAEAKAILRGGTTTIHVDGSVSAAELRAWAKSHDIDCPDMGRVPKTVREAFEAAQDRAS